ncbi:hypothetical protein [Acaryochloris sp. CCMEE 5410]|uniref:hypothetical protein n=1 Tax=Acaryochloris sp. CCMEE 5410 TaxID=310037 RepID=UPI0002484469|nr:hypothetical protein [Acaryochloris sp. CCMEE 5410]KAI9129559.1 hypothetical protein ON05_033160 [Acaryochloris sp. CCMEE 5410]
MKKQFSILSIDKGNLTENPNVQDLNLKVQVDENIRFFSVQISEDSKFGFEGGTLSISKELEKITWEYSINTRDFHILIFDFNEGKEIDFPVEFKCWECPPGFEREAE